MKATANKIAVVMKVRMTLSLPLIFLLMIFGVFGQICKVSYKTTSICALKGSTVNMACYYDWYKLNDAFWIKGCDRDMKNLKEYPEYEDRDEYIEDREKQPAILRLHNVTENDESEYCCTYITEKDKEKCIGQPGIQLKVSALQVKAPQLVLEKERVNLTCDSTCSLTDGFIWYKNGQVLKIQSETLQLQSERSDSGRYSCAVRGHEHLPSPAVSITVMYPPKNVSVFISPSGEIVEGDSVTLSCSSDSNPPALNFSWFKENQSSAVGSGQSFIISSFNSSHSGRYYCEAQNQHGSQRSASVSVSVKVVGDLLILYIFIGVICGAAVGIVMFLIWRSRWMKTRNDSVESQMNHPIPPHDKRTTCDVSEPVYENVTMNNSRAHHDRHKACDVTEPVYDNIPMNNSRPHHDRRKACDVAEPVYENVTFDGKRL
uniref:Ig-like domain-containing protein n=1 Tax=Cyprinus carpio carpio TaxID=630221 RepID=A0A9J8AFT7_CYPCA